MTLLEYLNLNIFLEKVLLNMMEKNQKNIRKNLVLFLTNLQKIITT